MIWDDGYLISMNIPSMIIRSSWLPRESRLWLVSPLEGDHNISCDHEVEKDQQWHITTPGASYLTSMAGLGLI